jgi:tetratricopeptide (TPR) repeat protein
VRTAPAPEVGIEQAQAALAAGRFDDALACLAPLLPPRQPEAVSACRLWLLSAEALVGLGRRAEARGHLIHAWVPPGPLLALPGLRAHELQIRLRLGELLHLGDALTRCLDALGEDRAGRAALLADLARAHDDAGELEAALRCWEEALALSDDGGCGAHLQLGRLEHLRGNDVAALEHFAVADGEEASLRKALIIGQPVDAQPSPLARVVDDFSRGPAAEGVAEKALRLGTLALREGLWRDARDWLARAARLASEEGITDLRRRALEGSARVAAAEGDYQRASGLYELAVREGAGPDGLLDLLLAAACRRGDALAVLEFGELRRCDPGLPPWAIDGRPFGAEIQQPEAGFSPEGALVNSPGRKPWVDWLRDRARPATPAVPHLARLAELQLALSPGQVFASLHVVGPEAWLLVCTADAVSVTSASPIDQMASSLDERLRALGEGPLGEALWRATEGAHQLLWVSDAPEDIPVVALRRGGRYLVERVSVVHAVSGSLLVHQANHPAPWRWGRAVVVDGPEADGIAATFWFPTRLPGPDGLAAHLPSAKLVHLPAGECPKGDVDGLPLVVLGGAGVQAARALLARGARSVVAGLWRGPTEWDQNASPLLWAFYRHLMTHPPAEALALAQRELLYTPTVSWAGFAFFGDPLSLPAAGWPWAWLARWGQSRHAQLFPSEGSKEASHAV